MRVRDILLIVRLFRAAHHRMVEVVRRRGDARELSPIRAELVRRMLEIVARGTARAYSEGYKQAANKRPAEIPPALQRQADEFGRELTKGADGMERDAVRALNKARQDAEEAERQGVKFEDKSGRRWQPHKWAELVARTHDAVIRNSGHLRAAQEINSPGVRVSDGGNPTRDGRHCSPCAEVNGEYWSLTYAAAHPILHPNCRRSFAAMGPSDTRDLDRA